MLEVKHDIFCFSILFYVCAVYIKCDVYFLLVISINICSNTGYTWTKAKPENKCPQSIYYNSKAMFVSRHFSLMVSLRTRIYIFFFLLFRLLPLSSSSFIPEWEVPNKVITISLSFIFVSLEYLLCCLVTLLKMSKHNRLLLFE